MRGAERDLPFFVVYWLADGKRILSAAARLLSSLRMADVDTGADKSDLPNSDLPKASWNASATTAKNTTAPTTTPTIEMMTAAMLVPFDFPDRHNPTMPRMNAAESNTHPTMSAPGIQANTNPVMLSISATTPTVLLCLAGIGGWTGDGGSG
jgi:hypothetical protein